MLDSSKLLSVVYRSYARLVARQIYEGLSREEYALMMDLRRVLRDYWAVSL